MVFAPRFGSSGAWPTAPRGPAACHTTEGEAGRSGVRLSASLGHLVPRPVGAGGTAPLPALSPLPVVLRAPSSAVDGALQLPGAGEDVLVLDDDGFDQLVHVGLAGHLVVALRHRHERGPEADGEVVGVHHVLLAELR